MKSGRRSAERGQALLIVLVFIAAFLLVLWTGLTLASAAFLGLGSVRADTRNTYALDAGVEYAIQFAHTNGRSLGCNSSLGNRFTIGSAGVSVDLTPAAGCKANKPTYTVNVTNLAGGRQLAAQIHPSNASRNATWILDWEAYR